MRTAETVLSIIQERGKRGLPLEEVYRQLYNPDLYLRAYAKLYANDGAMTPGTTAETVDAMALTKIKKIIEALREERYRWTPVKRVYIAKKNGKLRPLGLPSWSDKLLQEVLRQILEAYYEPQFNQHSHGFRPERGCHSALREVANVWSGTKWFLEGDISDCFGSLDHEIMLSILGERIHDNRFLRLIQNLLQAGYLEDWTYHTTWSGSPQGGVISPVLSNIYLDKLDKYIEERLLPTYTKGEIRRRNPRYTAIQRKIENAKQEGHIREVKVLYQQLRQEASSDPDDPSYRRLRYVRYADDWLIGFIGPQSELEEIKRQIGAYLQETLKLHLSEEKTLITHAATEAARFLGYELMSQHATDQIDGNGRRKINRNIGLRIPTDVIEKKSRIYMKEEKPTYRAELLSDDDYSIISRYQSEYRGIVQYYILATNIRRLNKLHWIMRMSLLKTLANKHKARVTAMVRKYQTQTETPYGQMKCLEVKVERQGKKPLIAQFGGIPLRRRKATLLNDQLPIYKKFERNELIKRLLADTCELCGSKEQVEVHHIRKLADLNVKGGKKSLAGYRSWQQEEEKR
ncbi:maturase [Ktedonospora formicarum]|uniref:Maturase n=1 Tax=Ktedonospora formicarum TaxID=2778364 RepID=A0A8J3MW53_9CHLR|nr:reverse transcriptase/maturase family protein [Ktedonospora formicarum]GHO47195.1 maturase [Ktedonospora formicarum]